MKQWEAQGADISYDTLLGAAAESTLASLIDVDDPRFTNPADMQQTLAEYCRETDQQAPETKGDYVRCVLRSLAARYKKGIDGLNALLPGRVQWAEEGPVYRRLFGEGALGAAFIPVFAEIERTEGRARAQLFLARILGLLVCALGLLVGLGVALTYAVQALCEPGGRWDVAMPLTRIMLPYAPLICVAAIVSAALNVRDRFAVPSLTPVILNVCWLAALLLVCPWLPAEGYWRIGAVCWGILLAGAAQIAFQLPELRRVGYRLRFRFSGWRASPYVRQVLLQMGPASLGIALAQVNICVDGWLAYYGAAWAPSALEYADRIVSTDDFGFSADAPYLFEAFGISEKNL